MPSKAPAPPAREEWTLIRNARQLLTLQGPSGPRQGPAMSELSAISNGSILIRNGVIEEVGTARRVENLAGARLAREIDAGGGIVLPAFVDAATALIFPPPPRDGELPRTEASALRSMSTKIVDSRATAVASGLIRHGCLTVGARTPGGSDLRNVAKVLRAHQRHQSKPLRIRSVFSPRLPAGVPGGLEESLEKWLPMVRSRRLGNIVEFDLADFDEPSAALAARAAAGLAYTLRFRSAFAPNADTLRLALAAGAISVIAPSNPESALAAALAGVGGLRLYPAAEASHPAPASRDNIRRALSAGAAIAFCTDSRAGEAAPDVLAPANMEETLGFAVRHLGLSVGEAVNATIWNPACALRLAQATASIEIGKQADLVILALPDYRDLSLASHCSAVSLVIRKGQIAYDAG